MKLECGKVVRGTFSRRATHSLLPIGFGYPLFAAMFSVLVTGSNRGIGLELVRQLVAGKPSPKHVFAACRSPENARELQALKKSCGYNVTVHILKMDVTKREEIAEAVKAVDSICGDEGLTVLINNAGVCVRKNMQDVEEEDLLMHYRVNALAPYVVLKEMQPLLKKSAKRFQNGSLSCCRAAVINISSFAGSVEMTGHFHFEPIVLPYKTSKAALNMIMKTVSRELRRDGILVVVMCPGWVKTDMGTQEGELELEESIRSILHTLPQLSEKDNSAFLDRFGRPIPW